MLLPHPGTSTSSTTTQAIFEIEDDIHDGLGAFVRLNYDTRDEHAILLLASNFDSMYDLIYAPGVFVERWRTRYKETPMHNHMRTSSPVWIFETPMTIIIEPIALPTAVNANKLLGLGHLYPNLRKVACAWQTMPPAEFALRVQEAVSEVALKKKAGSTRPSTVGAPFVPQYLAEFALNTRTLTIRYFPRVPPDSKGQTLFPRHTRTFKESMTSMTINPVLHTEVNFFHFDMIFTEDKSYSPPRTHTPQQVADYRARWAMDFINDPSFINGLSWPKTFYSDAPLVSPRRKNALPDQNYPQDYPRVQKQYFRAVEHKAPYQPRVIIDSVWPDPDAIEMPPLKPKGRSRGGTPTTQSDPDPIPPLCVLLTGTAIPVPQPGGTYAYIQGPCTIIWDSQQNPTLIDANGVAVPGYQVSEALIKAYAPPTDPEV